MRAWWHDAWRRWGRRRRNRSRRRGFLLDEISSIDRWPPSSYSRPPLPARKHTALGQPHSDISCPSNQDSLLLLLDSLGSIKKGQKKESNKIQTYCCGQVVFTTTRKLNIISKQHYFNHAALPVRSRDDIGFQREEWRWTHQDPKPETRIKI